MVEGVVEFEADGASGSDGDSLGSRPRGDVATDIVGSHGRDGRVVDGLADGSRGGGAASNESVPDVVSGDGLGEDRKADEREQLHC